MSELYPLKFKPIFKEKIWGGDKVRSVFGMDFAPLANCGEAWVLSGYGEETSEVSNGFLAGNTLDELIEVYMGDLVGEAVYDLYGNTFPLLVKILNAEDWLSIQVHPGDELAASRHDSLGKTEMWYVADAVPGAQLISGFNREITPEVYLSHLEKRTLLDIMNYEKAEKGDVFFMPSGRVHALGPGLLIFEIQQTSDITYRIYDFDRVDEMGNSRQLHTGEALEAIDFTRHESYRTTYESAFNRTVPLVESRYFNTGLMHFGTQVVKDYSGLDSFVILQCAEGSCTVACKGGADTLKPGEVILVPAMTEEITIVPHSETRLLEIFYPQA